MIFGHVVCPSNINILAQISTEESSTAQIVSKMVFDENCHKNAKI
jgi:hypothetical protein